MKAVAVLETSEAGPGDDAFGGIWWFDLSRPG
jgi:hypothetical protein